MAREYSLKGAVFGALLCGLVAPASAGIKCWVNRDGVKECGNAVPAEYAQQRHEEKNKDGMTVRTTEKARTPEEVAVESAARKAREAEEAAVASVAKHQVESDRVLLATFSSEDDLVMARDGQLDNIESQVRVTESHIAKLDKSLDQMIARAAAVEKQGKKVSKELANGIENTRKQIEDQKQFIETKRTEQSTIHQKFQGDLARFRELRASDAN